MEQVQRGGGGGRGLWLSRLTALYTCQFCWIETPVIFFSCSYYSLQGVTVSICAAPVPDSDAVCQEVLHRSVERCHYDCLMFAFLRLQVETLLSFLDESRGLGGPV